MKLRDNKKSRNHRLWRQMEQARDKRENAIGIDTGYRDCNDKPIFTGDYVGIVGTEFSGIVLFHKDCGNFAVFRGLWYGDLNEYDPRCYGKVEYHFGKSKKCMNLKKESD